MILTGLFITFLITTIVIAIGSVISNTHRKILENKIDYIDVLVAKGFLKEVIEEFE